jgi:Flp pilus assembly protein TadG
LVVIGGIVDFGFLFQRYEVVTNAAREGARLASLPGYNATDIDLRVRAYIGSGLGMTTAAVTAAVPTVGGVVVTYPLLTVTAGPPAVDVSTAKVDVVYTHQFIMLGSVMRLINANWANSFVLRATSQMRLEPGAGPAAS